MLVHRV